MFEKKKNLMKRSNITLVLPCYNEAEHFEKSVRHILETLRQANLTFEIIFVEDKSTDSTRELVTQFAKKHRQENIHVICHKQNLGRGVSVRDGILKAAHEIV